VASFNDTDLKLIDTAKRTMRILSKVIGDKDLQEVIRDTDLANLIGNRSLDEALADPEIGDQIRARVTTDLPQLNSEQEALAIVQLGPAIFGQLWTDEDED